MNREARQQCYEALLDIMKKYSPDATIDTLKRKLENLRSSYKREHKRVEDSKAGIGKYAKTPHVSKLWYFELLTFLDGRESEGDGTECDFPSDNENIKEVIICGDSSQSNAPKKRKYSPKQLEQQSSPSLLVIQEEEWEVTAKSWALQLKDLSTSQKTIATKLISDVLFFGKLEKLNLESALQVHSMANSIVQYVLVRGDLITKLQWPLGAVIAQACHACTAVTHLFHDDELTQEYLKDLDNMHKVVLEVPTEAALNALAEKLKENNIDHKLWMEQPENIPTCLVVKPYPKTENLERMAVNEQHRIGKLNNLYSKDSDFFPIMHFEKQDGIAIEIYNWDSNYTL
ncbi:hypothetical protein GE061_012191 [Apolygus lucorum]|uniref:peptidyl-tRNA hydrolase n=1 Tax=Apolygus lucorum TaxID=248454 RepID=A0A8S9XRW8_APOLU|nr:hypothetical protein GE061_012191 [Apolygus lucorum]